VTSSVAVLEGAIRIKSM